MRLSPTMTKQQLIESQIDVTWEMHEADASQRVIARQLDISQATISRLFSKISITILKTRDARHVYIQAFYRRLHLPTHC